MDIVELPIDRLREAPWNPNLMDAGMLLRLRESLHRFGIVQNLVVRRSDDSQYEVLSGNQRLRVLTAAGTDAVSCVVVDLDDAQARLLAQALNRVQGANDLGLKAEALRDILGSISTTEVLSVLPESAESLQSLASLGEADLADRLRA